MTAKPLPTYAIVDDNGLYTLMRDGTAMQTPRSLPLATPHKAVAEAILAECQAQKNEKMNLREMPMTQMTLTVIDVTSAKRGEIIESIVRYGDSELLCQRAAEPADLVEYQNQVWQPYLDWIKSEFGAELRTGSGVAPFAQETATLESLRSYIKTLDDYRLTGFSEAVGASGSLVLGLAFIKGRSNVDEVFQAAELDHLWQMKKWGEDPVSAARHADIKRDLSEAARWLSLL